MFKKIFLMILCLAFLSPQSILAEAGSIEIVEVALARNIVDRQPANVFEPSGFCGRSEGKENLIPVIHSKTDTLVYLWTRVKAPAEETLLCTWFKAGMGWEKMGEITLAVKKSDSYRTWSSKKIVPGVHNGKWMVVISRASDPETALCKVDFEVID
ncbi:MAG: DUF2914 domain-containing protein [Desulfobacterales bacterium]|uniref:DUF2914 domain-containing protein n=1 Tax=Candidatus Desulfatibia profunda TaxID=2841695 RepID=A0A8J6NPR1_9BACT|nr:DUF2914 domain-containing protein [Candidatus Desulfatibia profunda]MBL7179707.1 DUF2914 domain-containing protein [Desulfobacterales bacterium]MBU0698440.1 DUF2914 domain-containing protein [Pseudomonadota bacterium]